MTARHHHHVPQFYLRGFTAVRSKKAKLHVIDFEEGRAFATGPRNVGGQRDFNRVDADGHALNAVEQALGEFEGEIDKALQRVVAGDAFPAHDDFVYILNFLALLSVRSPRKRKTFGDFQANIFRQLMQLIASSPERFHAEIAKAKQHGSIDPALDVSYEQAVEFLNSKYEIETPTGSQVETELETMDAVLDCLARRKWSFLRAAPDSGGFITCDHPARLVWSDPNSDGRYPPGHGIMGTEVVFPLSKDMAMRGTFEGAAGFERAGAMQVAMINMIVANGAQRQIYSADDQFRVLRRDGQGRRTSARSRIRAARRSGRSRPAGCRSRNPVARSTSAHRRLPALPSAASIAWPGVCPPWPCSRKNGHRTLDITNWCYYHHCGFVRTKVGHHR